VVVGAGKAGAGMAVAVEEALGDELLEAKRVEGWINVPADCLAHAADPSPPGASAWSERATAAAAAGAGEILAAWWSRWGRGIFVCV